MKRAALTMILALAAAAITSTLAGAQPTHAVSAQAAAKKQKVLVGFYKNRTVNYFDYGRIKLRPGNKLAPIWVFSNGADGQRSIVDSAPGDKQYSALHKVNTVTWKTNAPPRVLRSAAAVRSAQANGDLTIRGTSRVVNAAVLGFGQTRHAGFAKGKTIHYYELGLVEVAPGNEILPIWTFTNGVDGQSNIADVVPGTTAYPPLWAVVEVTWKAGAERSLVRSFEQLQQARKAGAVTLKRTSMVVNCPFV
ncbi:MAG: hypothetical protein M3546_13755 [Actinomycetota bacterium]|nr:hypothetical protein [Actinomycetota bacterium]